MYIYRHILLFFVLAYLFLYIYIYKWKKYIYTFTVRQRSNCETPYITLGVFMHTALSIPPRPPHPQPPCQNHLPRQVRHHPSPAVTPTDSVPTPTTAYYRRDKMQEVRGIRERNAWVHEISVPRWLVTGLKVQVLQQNIPPYVPELENIKETNTNRDWKIKDTYGNLRIRLSIEHQ